MASRTVLDRSAVIGAGLMGSQIGLVLAMGSRETVLMSRTEKSLNRALERLSRYADDLNRHGLLPGGSPEATLAKVSTTTSVEEAASNAEFIVESVYEDLEAKRKVFVEMEHWAPLDAVLATNTSSLPIGRIAEGLKRPERVVGSHFVQPAHIVPIVEVTKSEKTSEETVRRSVEVWRRLGKMPLIVKLDVPGFVVNRLQHALVREAVSLLADGVATAEDIDLAVSLGLAPRFTTAGPLEQRDINGLAMHLQVASYLWRTLSGWEKPLRYLEAKVRSGELGLEAGRGYYDWTGLDSSAVRQEKDEALIERTLEALRWMRERRFRPTPLS